MLNDYARQFPNTDTSVRFIRGIKMNKKNMRKTAPRAKVGYLTAKERKIVEWYESKRLEEKQRGLALNLANS